MDNQVQSQFCNYWHLPAETVHCFSNTLGPWGMDWNKLAVLVKRKTTELQNSLIPTCFPPTMWLQVHVNHMDTGHLVFQEMNLGTDNTVCRHGIHGLYCLFSANFPSSLLVKGDNSIFLTQARGGDSLCGVLYDYLRLEAPATAESSVSLYPPIE